MRRNFQRVLATFEPVGHKADRKDQTNYPMCQRGRGTKLIVTNVVQQVSADDQPAENPNEDTSRETPLSARPSRRDMNAPEQAEDPDRCEGEGPMQRQRP